MLERNVTRVLKGLKNTDAVLDIGGWACPFNRANYVIDLGPYESRDYYKSIGMAESQGGAEEHFTKETWIQRDLCSREPFPFANKSIDYVVCSHTLEDIRDPLWVCSEMIRVAKRGYIEFPSRIAESCRGWENPLQAGLSHHRWLIEIVMKHIIFTPKYHMLSSHWKYAFPRKMLLSLSEEERVTWLFWEDSFTYEEKIIHGVEAQALELQQYREHHLKLPVSFVKADALLHSLMHRRYWIGRLWRALF